MCDSDSDSDLLANLLSTVKDDDDDDPKPSTVTDSQQTKFDQEPDSDDELLATLLGTDDDNGDSQSGTVDASSATQESNKNDSTSQIKSNALKELDFNFLDDISDDINEKTEKPQSPKKGKNSSALVEDNADSSDEEDKKYFEAQRYSEYGREIKRLIKTQETEKESLSTSLRKENSFNSPVAKKDSPSLSKSFKTKVNSSSSLSSSFNGSSDKSDKYCLQAAVTSKTPTSIKKDVYSDPIFGFRIVNPLVSSADLIEKMQGRKPVTISGVKLHLLNSTKSQEDWVIAGIVLSKSATRTSVKGTQYTIWKMTDLSMEMNTISMFLFSSAYKHLWKIPTGTVVGVLNPSILETKDNKDLATLSVDNEHKVMILGISKDLGKCKSMKKNGEPCTAPVNLRHCEYCVYHVKQEYGKFSKRTDLQSHGLSNTIGHLGTAGQPKKPMSIYQQRNPEAKPFISIPAKKNEVQIKKDRERLAMLKGHSKVLQKSDGQLKLEPEYMLKATSVEMSANQTQKDLARLNKLRGWSSDSASPSSQPQRRTEMKMMLPSPKLATGLKNGFIDFSEPTPKALVNKAKLMALEYVKRNGAFKKTNPNQTRPSKEVLSDKGMKRRREEEDGETAAEKIAKKEIIVKNRFQEMLEKKSAHTDLIEKHEDEETEQYFRKQLAKERMEEKMLTTYKVACKAVQCKVCKYVAFSSSDLCKKLQHPVKVFDAVKRFFKCDDCGNRTVSLDRIPTETCKRCSSSKWVRAAMMDEKKTQLAAAKLSIRGAEEKFIGAAVSGENLDLLVPESD